ncbi:hypothetical protein ZIOFF_060880 [Zingiber officinale]|uniref:Uncharacterized protein n=1 Tax=Zingiber officinale TaxID=94328 RepID=A0A8J5FF29_ZINOF|nr:hypothetical protein ZIOFF_060880 [Zingiber officinale]
MIDDDGGLAANQNDCRGSYYNSGHELVVGLDTKKGYVKPSLPEAFAARTHCRNNSLPLRNSSLPLFTTVAVAVAGLLSTSRNSPPPAVGILSTSLHRPLPAARLHSASPHSPSSATRLPSISPYHRTTARIASGDICSGIGNEIGSNRDINIGAKKSDDFGYVFQSNLRNVSRGDICANTKCKLLHWSTDELVVAEGRIASTDPNTKVHHVILGGSC